MFTYYSLYQSLQLTILALCMVGLAYGQVDSSSIRLPKLVMHNANKSLIEQAVEGAVYLVRQEYQLKSPAGESFGRGIADYFGKAYGIGILVNRQLWMPTNIRKPWTQDPNFAEYSRTHEPFCSVLKIKPINQNIDYRSFKSVEIDTSQSVTYFSPGTNGIPIAQDLPVEGNLLIYYVERDNNPDDDPIKSSFIRLTKLVWDESGTAEMQEIQFKDRLILGGALFSEEVHVGRIEVKLVALYIDTGDHWVLQAPPALLTGRVDANR